MNFLDEIYPYEKDPSAHPFAWVFFHICGIQVEGDLANQMAKHVFDDLGCGAPGTTDIPSVKYDAQGGSGAPWEQGMWIAADEPRLQVVATAPPVSITAMDEAQRAELRAALDAADDAARAGAAGDA